MALKLNIKKTNEPEDNKKSEVHNLKIAISKDADISDTSESASSEKVVNKSLKLNNIHTNPQDKKPKKEPEKFSILAETESVKTKEIIDKPQNINLDISAKSTNKSPVPPEQGFNLSFTPDGEYDLDDLIATKKRSKSDAAIMLQVFEQNQVEENIIEIVTKDILDDHGIKWTEETYKTDISQIHGFNKLFDIYLKSYYDIYLENQNEITAGSISMDTVLHKIVISHDDYRKYLLESGEYPTQIDQYLKDYNKPDVVWTEGTLEGDGGGDIPDPEPNKNCKDMMLYVGVDVYDHVMYLNDSAVFLNTEGVDEKYYSLKDNSISHIEPSGHPHTIVTGYHKPQE